MKKLIVPILGVLLSSCAMQTVESQKMPETAPAVVSKRTPVIVELFTSEGCSSCPAADRALEFLRREQPVPNAEIITLAMHVDYWDRLGWKDSFSSPLFTGRQESYRSKLNVNSIYTPQMVIDGSSDVVGSDTGRATRLIMDAASKPKARVDASVTGDELSFEIRDVPKHGASTVFLAIVEDGLTREIGAGENRGKTLEHSSVVRDLTALESIPSERNSVSGSAQLKLKEGWSRTRLSAVIFVQEDSGRKMLGSVKVTLE